jgi:Rrf2 family nitric oxide-sensitive transcriptional repressor
MHLAVNPGRRLTIAEVANRFGISKNHLMKVAQTLSGMGVIDSVPGRNGGMILARPAKAISLGEIARPLESGTALVECFPGGQDQCLITRACRLKGALAEAREAFFAVLDGWTLDQLAGGNTLLEDLLAGAAR